MLRAAHLEGNLSVSVRDILAQLPSSMDNTAELTDQIGCEEAKSHQYHPIIGTEGLELDGSIWDG